MHFSPEEKNLSQVAMPLREWVAASRDDGKDHYLISHHTGAAKRQGEARPPTPTAVAVTQVAFMNLGLMRKLEQKFDNLCLTSEMESS